MSPRNASRLNGMSFALILVVMLAHAGSVLAQSTADMPPQSEHVSDAQPTGLGTDDELGCVGGARALRVSCLRVSIGTLAADAASQSQATPGVLTLRDAIQRALKYNLTITGLGHAVTEGRGVQRVAKSQLLPNLTGEFSGIEQRINLAALGVKIEIPEVGFTLPNLVGPFGVLDLRARLSQSIFDLQAIRNHKATGEAVRASEFTLDDARDLVVLTVGRVYLEGQAARARVEATRAQVQTAVAIHERALQQIDAGLATPLDVNRAEVQTLMAQQRLVTLEAALAKQKIELSRLTGLPAGDQYDLEEGVPFSPAPPLTLEAALKQAAEQRADLQAAEARVRAAELSLAAMGAERAPTASLAADYGASLAFGNPTLTTYAVQGVVRIPLWEGGRIDGQVAQASAALSRRRAERDDLRAQIDAEIRKAYVDVRAAEMSAKVSERNVQVTRETLGLTRQRFNAGVSDNVSVVQSQESQATAERDYIDSVLAHNLAKLDLARFLGRAAEDIDRFLQLQGTR
jgi:outer membrane protein TolC